MNLLNREYVFLILVLLYAGVSAQSNQLLRSQAITAMNNKDWNAASQYYSRLYARDSSQVKVIYRFAEASRLNFEIDHAIYLYRRVVSLQPQRFPMSYYWLGQLEKNRENYAAAKSWFTNFNKQKRNSKNAYYKDRSRRELDICDYAGALILHPVIDTCAQMPAPVNTRSSEYSPVEKDSTFYFSSIRAPERREAAEVPYYSKIYAGQLKKNSLQRIKALDTNINAGNYHNSNVTFAPGGRNMIFSRCSSVNAADYHCELFSSVMAGKRWTAAIRLEEPVNLKGFSTTHPAFGMLNGKNVLFFSSDRPGGEGGMDIWYSTINDDGQYTSPVNAGKNVNTPDDEITPWYDVQNGHLYFSSTFHQSLGGFDVFRCVFTENGFQSAINVGYPVNTGYNEVYYNSAPAGRRYFISSNRPGSFTEGAGSCCNDIYTFTVDTSGPPPVAAIDTVKIFKDQMKLLVPLTLYFHNDEPEPRTRDTVTLKTYDSTYAAYYSMIPKYRKEYSKGLKGIVKDNARADVEDFFRDSVETGFLELERFADLLEKVLRNGETVKVTMKGYCSPLASNDYNIRLAKRRISSLRNYFMRTRGGLFAPYTFSNGKNGRLLFENVDIGELEASKASDDLKDTKNSVYSPFAASERKIQVIAVSFAK
jgi:hypothetical protein